MPLQVVCPGCGNRLAVDQGLLGKQIRCGTCGVLIDIANPVSPGKPSPGNPAVGKPAVGKPAAPRPPSAIPKTGATAQSSRWRTGPQQSPSSYHRRPPAKSNKPIVVTAVACLVTLVLLIGGAIAIRLFDSYRQAQIESASNIESAGDIESERRPERAGSQELGSPPTVRNVTTAAKSVTQSPLAKDKSPPIKETSSKPRFLPPPDEEGLQRVHLPEGYSIAIRPGFTASPRRIDRKTAVYALARADGVTLAFTITDDHGVHRQSPVPPFLSRPVSPDAKLVIRLLTPSDAPNQIDTFQVDGMNARFAEMEQDISHPDMTEYYQRLFSGAIPSDVKRQLEPQMKAVTAFRAAYMMKAMDDRRILNVVMTGVSDHSRRPPQEWFNILRTVRHESPPDPSRIPYPFQK